MLEVCNDKKKWIPPIYKVLLDVGSKRNVMYLFLGSEPKELDLLEKIYKETTKQLSDDEEERLKLAYGSNYANKLELKATFKRIIVKETIRDNDTIIHIKKILSRLLNIEPNNLYLWCENKVKNLAVFWNTVLTNLFQSSSLVSIELVNNVVSNLTRHPIKTEINLDLQMISLDDAVEYVCNTLKVTTVSTAMGFRYFKDDNIQYMPVKPGSGVFYGDTDVSNYKVDWHMLDTVESYNPLGRHIMCSKNENIINQDWYFPSWSGRNPIPEDNQINIEEKYTKIANTFNIDCFLSYVQIRNVENTSSFKYFDVDDMFIGFNELDLQIPFMKKTNKITGGMIKFHKSILQDESLKEDLDSWAKSEVFKRNKTLDTLVVKIRINKETKSYATLTILSNGVCDLRLKFGGEFKTNIKEVKEFIGQTNIIIQKINNKLTPFDKYVLNDNKSHTKIVRMTCASMIKTSTRIADTDSVIGMAVSPTYSNYFSIMPNDQNKNIHMIYKKVDQFGSDEAITYYIARQVSLKVPKAEIKIKLMYLFGLSEKETNEYVQNWDSKFDSTFNKYQVSRQLLYKPVQYVNIKLTFGAAAYAYSVDGLTRVSQFKNIMRIMQVLLHDAVSSAKKLKKQKIALKKEKNSSNAKDENINENMLNLFDAVETEIDLDIFENDDDKLNEWLHQQVVSIQQTHDNDNKDSLDDEFETSSDIDNAEENNGKENKTKAYDSTQLRELEAADKRLFDAQRKISYAKVCQKSAERQPVVVTKHLAEQFQRTESIKNFVNYGSTPELAEKNYYICPDVWCPKTKVALSREQYILHNKQCPQVKGISEIPMVFYEHPDWNKDKGKPNQRYVGFLPARNHKDHLCMPCCFKRDTHTTGCISTKKKNGKYILANGGPAEKDRYATLPLSLSILLKNESHKGGLMPSKAKLFLRQGLDLTKQSFLHTMSQILQNDTLTSSEEIISAISKNINMKLFMTLENGRLFKRFVSAINRDSIYNQHMYNQFRVYVATEMKKNKLLNQILHGMMSFANTSTFARLVSREFFAFMALQGFKEYLNDDRIVKSHEFLLDLCQLQLSWLNSNGYNIIIVETDSNGNTFIPCTQREMRSNKPFILLIKIFSYYEPIVLVEVNKHELSSKMRFILSDNTNVNIIVNYIEKQCEAYMQKEKILHAQQVIQAIQRSTLLVKHIVIDYDLQVQGYILTKENIFVPVKKPGSLQLSTVSFPTATIIFVSDVHNYLSTSTPQNVDMVFQSLNKLFPVTQVTKSSKNKHKDYFSFKLEENSLILDSHKIIKIVPLNNTNTVLFDQFEEDMNMFIQWQTDDARRIYMNKIKLEQALHVSIWNEAIKFISSYPTVLSQVQFLRHHANPLPNAYKYKMLRELLESNAPSFLNRLYFSAKASKGMDLDQLTIQNCSMVANKDKCRGQCTWLEVLHDDKKYSMGGRCRLNIPDELKENILSRLFNELINPFIPMRQKLVMTNSTSGAIVILTDNDIRAGVLTGLLGSHIVDAWGFHRKDFQINAGILKEASNASQHVGKTYNLHYVLDDQSKENLPTDMKSTFKEYNVYPINLPGTEYTGLAFYEFFALIYNKINNTNVFLTGLQLKEHTNTTIFQLLEQNKDNTLKELEYNIWFKYKQNTELNATEILQALDYYPSLLDLKIIAQFLHINIFVVGRKSARNPDKKKCLGKFKDTQYFVFLKQTPVNAKNFDTFNVIAKKDKFLLEKADVENIQDIQKYCTQYTSDGKTN
jgi:hypothetical protein